MLYSELPFVDRVPRCSTDHRSRNYAGVFHFLAPGATATAHAEIGAGVAGTQRTQGANVGLLKFAKVFPCSK